MPVDPTGADLKQYMQEDTGGPVVMLNLLRYKDGGGASYKAYSAAIQPFLEKVGARVVYAGDCATPLVAFDAGHGWDAVLLVKYPSRAAFSAMVGDSEYQQITHLRTDALEAAVLEATVPWTA